MDNASKALIMAGAILIAVAIVGIGIYIFSAANGMTDDALNQIDALTVTSINSQLQQYEGEIRGRELKQAINIARSINKQNTLPDGKTITYNGSQIIDTTTTTITDNKTYKVYFNYNTAGYIEDIRTDTPSAGASESTGS